MRNWVTPTYKHRIVVLDVDTFEPLWVFADIKSTYTYLEATKNEVYTTADKCYPLYGYRLMWAKDFEEKTGILLPGAEASLLL